MSTYFDSYGSLKVHQQMLLDRPRVDSYAKAIQAVGPYLKDKIVMDVGAGSGILSCFVAKFTEAKRVIAVEANPVMAMIARRVAIENGFSERVVVLQCAVEDLINVDIEEREFDVVDAIVSEWMGQYLLHESMLDSVIFARDQFLRKGTATGSVWLNGVEELPADFAVHTHGGLMLPSRATISCTLIHDPEAHYKHLGWVNDRKRFHGINIAPLADAFGDNADVIGSPIIDTVTPNSIDHCTNVTVADFNLASVTRNQLQNITHQQAITINGPVSIQGIALWFKVLFPNGKLELDTSPKSTPTHWQQTLILFPEALEAESDIDTTLTITMKKQTDSDRSYVIDASVE